MNIKYTTADGRLEFQFDASVNAEVWEKIASIQEVFEIEKCGLCGKSGFRNETRRPKDREGTSFTTYMLRCTSCQAVLRYVRMKPEDGGRIFARKQDSGVDLDNGGWSRWETRAPQKKPGSSTGYDPAKGDPPTKTPDAEIPF